MQKNKAFYQLGMFWKVMMITFGLIIVQTGLAFVLMYRMKHGSLIPQNISVISTVSASEIYPEFTCPCCDKPLDKDDPCCGAMTNMIDFIDVQVENGLNEEDIYLATVKEFGIDRLTSEEKQSEIRQMLADRAPADSPKLIIEEDFQNLGEHSASQGVIQTVFTFKNEGKSDLIIDELTTSCGCTSATIIYKGIEGPAFTMAGHGAENPTDWGVSIKPGSSAILRIYYDPNFHGDMTGPVTRTASIFSNDPVNFDAKVTITLDQVQ